VPKAINVGDLVEAGRLTFKGTREHSRTLKQTFNCCINTVFYIARTRRDTKMMKRAVRGRRLTYGSEAKLHQQ